MGWGICFALDDQGRVYCADGCNWRATKADYDGYYPWPSARQAVLDYFESNSVHRELDMIRDECPGTAAALKEACEEHIRCALCEYDSLTAEKKTTLHAEKMKKLESEVQSLEADQKEAYQSFLANRKQFNEYKPSTRKPKTRIDELQLQLQPLNLELNMEYSAEAYDRLKKNLTRVKRNLKLEKLFRV